MTRLSGRKVQATTLQVALELRNLKSRVKQRVTNIVIIMPKGRSQQIVHCTKDYDQSTTSKICVYYVISNVLSPPLSSTSCIVLSGIVIMFAVRYGALHLLQNVVRLFEGRTGWQIGCWS